MATTFTAGVRTEADSWATTQLPTVSSPYQQGCPVAIWEVLVLHTLRQEVNLLAQPGLEASNAGAKTRTAKWAMVEQPMFLPPPLFQHLVALTTLLCTAWQQVETLSVP